MEFTDISCEQQRTYIWSDGKELLIEQPIALNVSASGGHRVEDLFGNGYYIPAGWRFIKWTAKEGQPVFVC